MSTQVRATDYDDALDVFDSARRRRRTALGVFAAAVALASFLPRNDRAIWTVLEDPETALTATTDDNMPIVLADVVTTSGTGNPLYGVTHSAFNGRGGGYPGRAVAMKPGDAGRSRFGPRGPRPDGAAGGPDTGTVTDPATSAALPSTGMTPGGTAAASNPVGVVDNVQPVETPSGFQPTNPGAGLPGWSTLPVTAIEVLPIAAVPEPATWAMMVIGFGAVGFAMRRRPAKALVQA